ncbi:MAG: sugar ABC transporter permease [Saprospiraceae bacterium]|nr:sugar ABC transporter permease [Saprospiraceae bacterium]
MAVETSQPVKLPYTQTPSKTWFGVSRLRRREAIDGILMVLPWMIGFVVFLAGPMLFGVFTSLTRWDIISPPIFVGLENFQTMFSGQDELFGKSLAVTGLYTLISAPLHVVLAFILASLLNSKVPFKNFFRSAFYLPSILPVVASAILWSWVFNPDFGLLYYGLSFLGFQGPKWLADKNWSLAAIIIMNLQYIGPNMIIMLAGLQRVPIELIEAAQLDGANRWHMTRYITIPMVSSVIFLVIINNINASFQTFTQAFLMTGGGPQYSTYFYMLHLYNQAWVSFKMGYASAMAWVMFVIIIGFLYIHFRLSRLWVYSDVN